MGFHPFVRQIAIGALASLALAGWGPNALAADCPSLFSRILSVFSGRSVRLIPDAEIALWRGTFGKEGSSPHLGYLPRKGEDGIQAFWLAYRDLDPSIRRTLEERMPAGRFPGAEFLRKLQTEVGEDADHDSFLRTIEDFWLDQRPGVDSGTLKDLASRRLGELESGVFGEPSKVQRLREVIREETRALRASRIYSGLGVSEIGVERKGKKAWVRLGGERYPAVQNGDQWLVEVPREKVGRPAWNPLDTATLSRYMARGEKQKSYPAVVGADGRFYLMDKNHRFVADPSPVVRVSISDPPRTVPFRNYLDLIGIPQPSNERILDIVEGRAGLLDLLPPAQRERVESLGLDGKGGLAVPH